MANKKDIGDSLSDGALLESAGIAAESLNPEAYAAGLGNGERLYFREEEKSRVVRVFSGAVPLYKFTRDDILVSKYVLKGGKVQVASSSLKRYEPATDQDSSKVHIDTNFRAGEEIMDAQDFIEALGVLNNASVFDYTDND